MSRYIKTINFTDKEAKLVEVNTRIAKGINKFIITGNATKEIKEASNRIISSIKSYSIKFPYGKVISSLTPANIKKIGTHYDLPIALSILDKQYNFKSIENYIICGELGIDGKLVSFNNPFRLICEAVKLNYENIILPNGPYPFINQFQDINIYQAENLKDVINYLTGKSIFNNKKLIDYNNIQIEDSISLNSIISQKSLIRALIVAIAGKHNILIKGPVGSGKTLSIKSIRSVFPLISIKKSFLLSDIYTRRNEKIKYINKSNVVYLNNNITKSEFLGTKRKLGIISESNFGFIVFDEINLFSKSILDNLKFIMDNDEVFKYNKIKYIEYPVDFAIIATMNPCLCGNYRTNKKCNCTITQVLKYNDKFDKSLLDRFHIKITINSLEKINDTNSYNIINIREKIKNSLDIQYKRYKNEEKSNGQLNLIELHNYIKLSDEIVDLLNMIMNKYKLSKRAIDNIIKVSRTIADLENNINIQEIHILEALKYQI